MSPYRDNREPESDLQWLEDGINQLLATLWTAFVAVVKSVCSLFRSSDSE